MTFAAAPADACWRRQEAVAARNNKNKPKERKGKNMKRNLVVALSTFIVCAALGPAASTALAQRGGGGGGTPPALDPVAREALITALTSPVGEYAARAEYTAILAKFGNTMQPYARILQAEQQHIAALQQQCVKYGVPIPPDTYAGNVTAPATLLEAAQTGVTAELLNVALYDELLTKVRNYPSLVQVFTNLRAASLNNHLPAFEAAVANGGTLPPKGTCVPQPQAGDQVRDRVRDQSCQ
jgi:hypothetical protein